MTETARIKSVRKSSKVKVSTGSRKPVGAVVGAIRILRYLTDVAQPVRVTDVARSLEMNPSTSLSILRTLVDHNLVVQDPISKVYTVGLGLVALSKNALMNVIDVRAIQPYLDKLAYKHQITVALVRQVDDNHNMVVGLATSDAPMTIHMAIGARIPAFSGATGRCVAAFGNSPKAKILKEFGKIAWSKPLHSDEYWQQVEETRKKGFSIDNEYFAKGVLTVAAPVLGREKSGLMSVSAIMFKGQYSNTHIEKIAAELQDLAEMMKVL